MTKTLAEQIAEIYELDAKRSPLEFSVHYDHPSGNNYYSRFKRVIMAGKNRYPIAAILGDPRSAEENEANAQFLASSTKMVSIIRELEAKLEKARGTMSYVEQRLRTSGVTAAADDLKQTIKELDNE